ncbi:MAG: DUF2179 domain-containing protein [Cyclobacteriaceae bacterium]
MFEFDFISYLLLPFLIFLARAADVTLATVKLMFIVNNAKRLAMILGFFEALITILALSRIMQDASNLAAYIMYAAGFAAGTYLGMRIEEKLAYGSVLVRIISKQIPAALLDYLASERYNYSRVEASDQAGNSQVLFTVCKRRKVREFLLALERTAPGALYTTEAVNQASHELLPQPQRSGSGLDRFGPNGSDLDGSGLDRFGLPGREPRSVGSRLGHMLSAWGKRTHASFYYW